MAASNKLARARNRHVMGNTLAGRFGGALVEGDPNRLALMRPISA